MAYVLKGVDKRFVRPYKNYSDRRTVTISLPTKLKQKYDTSYGEIIVTNQNISETEDGKVDVTLFYDSYTITIKKDGKLIKDTASSEEIYQHYLFVKQILKEKGDNSEQVILRHVRKKYIRKAENSKGSYQLLISAPQRLQHLTDESEKYPHPLIIVYINNKEDIIENETLQTYDIRLSMVSYSALVHSSYYEITRGEILEAYKKDIAYRASENKKYNDEKQEAERISSASNDYDILRHINHKSISYNDNGTAAIGVNIPESLKEKASTWWCSITVPASNIVNEGRYKKNYFSSVKLYKTEYEASIPIDPTSNHHKDYETRWDTVTVSRDELIKANEAHIQDKWEFFKNFDRFVEP